MTYEQVLRRVVPYGPTVSLTPSGFKGYKNLTINKMSLYPRYYDRLCDILPNSVFNPKHDEGIMKETICLGLIIEAYNQGMSPLAEDLHNTLHFELKNEELPVMKARLEYLISLANEQPIVKIIPACPYEAY